MILSMEQATAIDHTHIQHIRTLLAANPQWNLTHLSVELCKLWGWQSPAGQYKDMACRSLLLKLERAGRFFLPPRQEKNTFHSPPAYPTVPHRAQPIRDHLKVLVPLRITVVSQDRSDYKLFNCLLSQYHYLSYRGAVGENLKYLIRDVQDRPLACLLFGSAAWKTAPRDAFIGWNQKDREGNLRYLTNNLRFLILPWVRVPHLASHILSRIARRISRDWEEKYGHPICLLETFPAGGFLRGHRLHRGKSLGRAVARRGLRNDRNHDL